MLNQAVTPVTCPQCGNRFSAATQRIFDVEKDPTAKSRVLSGQANVARCPVCGTEFVLNAPFVYHDRAKELLLTYMPPAFGKNESERQRVIGEMTTAVMNSLPPEQRKAYLLQPKMFITIQSLIEAVLQADGVTKEMLDAQKQHVQIINSLLQSRDAEAFKHALDENRDKIDFSFFETLSASIEASDLGGQQRTAEVLNGLRLRLIQEFGLPVGEKLAGEGSKGLLTRERLLEKLQETEDEKQFEQLVIVGRPLMDYGFFQDITSKIEDAEQGGDKQKAKSLSSLRARVLEITETMDATAKEVVNQATDLLRGALEADDPDQFLTEHLDEISEAFFVVLSANLNAAEQGGQKEAADKLQHIAETAVKMLQEAMPPEIQLLNRLMAASYPAETQQILNENPDLVTPELLTAMTAISDDLTAEGNVAAADKLKRIIVQAQAVGVK